MYEKAKLATKNKKLKIRLQKILNKKFDFEKQAYTKIHFKRYGMIKVML